MLYQNFICTQTNYRVLYSLNAACNIHLIRAVVPQDI